jgi:hypothetical protein
MDETAKKFPDFTADTADFKDSVDHCTLTHVHDSIII